MQGLEQVDVIYVRTMIPGRQVCLKKYLTSPFLQPKARFFYSWRTNLWCVNSNHAVDVVGVNSCCMESPVVAAAVNINCEYMHFWNVEVSRGEANLSFLICRLFIIPLHLLCFWRIIAHDFEREAFPDAACLRSAGQVDSSFQVLRV